MSGCGGPPGITEPTVPAFGLTGDIEAPPQTDCHEGFCVGDTDPNPNSPGVWISNTVVPDICSGGSDNDGDGLATICENNLAAAFAPELVLSPTFNDPTTREPRWAARPLDEYASRVRISYLLSYHRDLGTSHSLCASLPGPPPWPIPWPYSSNPCDGHHGDSEIITLDVEYDYDTEHWLLIRAEYSAHEGFNVYETSGGHPKKLEYPGQVGGRPRAYVANGKHANYATSFECDAGGFWGFDNCMVGRFEVVVTGGNNNIGSDAVRLINCVSSSHPVFSQLGHQECYWTGTTFYGWLGPVQGHRTTAYRTRLIQAGFAQ